jgi:N-acetylneuraminic acid mutarotase
VIKRSIPNIVLHFTGGVQDQSSGLLSSRIDIYDPVTDTWSIAELSEPKFGMIAISGILAGGTSQSGMINKVEGIPGCLFQPNSFSYHSYGKVGNKLVFFVWDGKVKSRFDIFDISTNSWLIGVLDQPVTPSLVITVNNTIYVVGGYGNSNGYYDQVWKLDF